MFTLSLTFLIVPPPAPLLPFFLSLVFPSPSPPPPSPLLLLPTRPLISASARGLFADSFLSSLSRINRLSISIDPQDPHGSDSLSDEEDSSGVHVNSHDFEDYDNEWAHLSYPDELKPSDSASRPRTSHRSRSHHGSRSASGRPNLHRRMVPERDPRESYGTRSRRQPSPPESPDSGDSEEYSYPRAPAERRWPQAPPAPPGYAPSNSSGPTFGAFPPGHAPPYPHQNGQIPSEALVSLRHANPGAQPYGAGHYPYGAQFPASHGAAMHQYYPHDGVHPRHHSRLPQQSRIDPHHPSQPPVPPHLAGHVSPPYPGSPFHQELMHYAPQFYNYRDPYSMVPGMVPPYFQYPQVPPQSHPPEAAASPAPAPAPTPAPAPAPAPEPAPAPAPAVDAAKDEAIARLEKLIMDERTEREAKEAARLAAIEREAAEKAAREQQLAHDRKIAEEAAFLARADAEKRAAEAAAAAKDEAEKVAAAAASEAAAAATAAANAAATAAAAEAANAVAEAAKKPPPEKKKPIKFKDAVGRKFSFPFELCATWQGMEDLIKQAFLHIEVIGPHVAEGHYDLVGPNGDIILPQVWETVVEPDWTITMHMWPIPEKPKDADPPPAKEEAPAAPAKADPPAPSAEPKKKPEAPKKPVRKGDAGGFAKWMLGGRPPPKSAKAVKADKKPDAAPQ
ncbi:hypothetical protein PMG11_06226 [Penicillium brasilianum]|uniref:Ubiquitin-like domain-containing protein n=1 Tax=Penicillium brasilianum TaxID=104259 RepID=A0A0F7TNW2_PENBI|nr:hypothetical protein PMG11_06226 [Penicillium brasilianum]